MSIYSEKLKDPRWQKKRLEILDRDSFACTQCFNSERTLHVHHRYYNYKSEPWDYDSKLLTTLCDICHEKEKEAMDYAIARLSKAIKTHFLASDINNIAVAFEDYEHIHIPSVCADGIGYFLRSKEDFNSIIEDMFELLKRQANGE